MVCDICHKNSATVHLTEVVNGKVNEVHLCQECASEKAEEIQKQLNVSDLISSLTEIGGLSKKSFAAIICGGCGMSYEEFQKTGKFGCGKCYESFREPVTQLLRKIHGSTQHKGRFPTIKKDSRIMLQARRDELKKYLGRAISLEEYEEAARIRDELREVEKQLQKQDGSHKTTEERNP